MLIVRPKRKKRPTSKTKLTVERIGEVIAIRRNLTTMRKGGLYVSMAKSARIEGQRSKWEKMQRRKRGRLKNTKSSNSNYRSRRRGRRSMRLVALSELLL